RLHEDLAGIRGIGEVDDHDFRFGRRATVQRIDGENRVEMTGDATHLGRVDAIESLWRGEPRELVRMSRVSKIEDDERAIRSLRGDDEERTVVSHGNVA